MFAIDLGLANIDDGTRVFIFWVWHEIFYVGCYCYAHRSCQDVFECNLKYWKLGRNQIYELFPIKWMGNSY